MKDGILFVGPVGNGGGPSIKNDILIHYLGRERIKVWNTFDRSLKSRLGAIAQILFTPRKYIIVGVSYRGRNLLYPFLWIRQKLTGAHTACIVIGGNAVEHFNNSFCIRAMEGADFVTVETEGLKKEMEEAYGLTNLYLLPNYKQLAEITLPEQSADHYQKKVRFVFLSGMRNAKGVKTLLEAYRQIRAEGYDAELDYYGPVIEGDLDPKILEEIGDTEGAAYCGAVENSKVLETLSDYQVFVFPSEYEGEGFPAVLVEAMAAGLPVIASDMNYNPELISHGDNGFIFPHGDKEQLASYMKRCMEDRRLLEVMSANNQKKAMEYDARTLCRQFGRELVKMGWPLGSRRKKSKDTSKETGKVTGKETGKETGKRKPRVAVVLPYFYHGGAENMVSRLVSHLDPDKVEAEVFCIYGQPLGNRLEQAVIDHGIPIHYIGKGKGFSPSALIKLGRELDKFRPELIHTHLSACVYCAAYVLTHKVKMLHTVHNMPKYELIFPKRLVMHVMYAIRKAVPIALSTENQKLIEDFYAVKKPVKIIYNPVDVERYKSKRDALKKDFSEAGRLEDFFFLTAGRISEQKNHKLLLQAFAKAKKQIPGAKLVILGDGPLLETLKKDNQDPDVTFKGNVDNMEYYMAAADVFVLSSLYEGLPLVVLEAMASGLPVISTRVGGVCDVVTDNGILTEIDADALAEAMTELAKNPKKREAMSQAARRNVARFDSSVIAEEYTKAYLKLINKK